MFRLGIALFIVAAVAFLYLRAPSVPSPRDGDSAVVAAGVRAERRTLTVSTVAIGTVKPRSAPR